MNEIGYGEISFDELVAILEELDTPEIKKVGDGLYKFPGGMLASEKFLEKFNNSFLALVIDGGEVISIDREPSKE